jgi:YVTN family beta-propeller protein
LHGFIVIDLDQRKEVRRVKLPELPANTPRPHLDTYTHGLALTPDEKQLWVTSCPGGKVYVYALPEMELLGSVPTGNFPNWLTFRSDGKVLFVSNTNSNTVTAIDVPGRRALATIPVGHAPKRLLAISR